MAKLIGILVVTFLVIQAALAGENSINIHSCLSQNSDDFSIITPFSNEGVETNQWKYGDYFFKCDNETGYDCELISNNKIILKVNLFRDYDVNEFMPYIYLSKIQDQYKVILIEAQAERGTLWYYSIILKDNDLLDTFFIDQGRRFFAATKEYLARYPDTDEMYINPSEFLFVSICNGYMLFKLDKEYLYSSEENETSNKFIEIKKKL